MIIVLLVVLYIVSSLISEYLKDSGHPIGCIAVDVIACIIAYAIITLM